MSQKRKIATAIKVWIAIYPSITGFLFLFEDKLKALPLYLKTLLITVILVPWMVFVILPILDRIPKYFKKIIKYLFLFLFLTKVHVSFSQNIPIETVIGNKATNMQMLINKKIPKSNDWGIFSILNVNLPYDKGDISFRYHTIQTNITYSLSNNFSLYTGFFTNKFDYGPSIGVLTKFKIKNGFVLLNNRHSIGNEYVTALLFLTEYQPRINNKINLYTRIQVLSETNFSEAKRNFQMLRIGISVSGYQFGLASTFDQFGSIPIKRSNHGLFFRIVL